jgi:hypothetical protein
MNDYIPTIILDFDGVLHSYESGWLGAKNIPDPPVPGAVEFVTEAVKHFKVAVYSTRSGEDGGIPAMQAWMCQHGFPVDEIAFPTTKPPALWSLDDRVDRFTGTFPDIDYIKAFKPWYENER